jgi:hypothetical protein
VYVRSKADNTECLRCANDPRVIWEAIDVYIGPYWYTKGNFTVNEEQGGHPIVKVEKMLTKRRLSVNLLR